MKELVLTRIPPGDVWKDVGDGEVLDSLTDALDHVFKRTSLVEFYIHARAGEVHAINDTPEPKVRESYSLYGE